MVEVIRRILILAAVIAVAGCQSEVPLAHGTPSEQMPGPASVWLTSESAAPGSPVEVMMTSLDDASIRLAHTFTPGIPARGAFAISEGRYVLAALGGTCSLPLALGPGEAADVLLTLGPGSACTLDVVRRGRMGDPAMQKTEDGVLITNGHAGAATPSIEPTSASHAP